MEFSEWASETMTDADSSERLRELGLSDREIVDVALAAAARNYYSRAIQALAVLVDDFPELSDSLQGRAALAALKPRRPHSSLQAWTARVASDPWMSTCRPLVGPSRLVVDAAEHPRAWPTVPSVDFTARLLTRCRGTELTRGALRAAVAVAGRRVAARPPSLDVAWRETAPVVAGARGGRPLWWAVAAPAPVSRAGTADEVGAVGVVCLAFPLHPPGSPEKSRLEELLMPEVPVLVLQGERDTFGSAALLTSQVGTGSNIRVVTVPGADHGSTKVAAASPLNARGVADGDHIQPPPSSADRLSTPGAGPATEAAGPVRSASQLVCALQQALGGGQLPVPRVDRRRAEGRPEQLRTDGVGQRSCAAHPVCRGRSRSAVPSSVALPARQGLRRRCERRGRELAVGRQDLLVHLADGLVVGTQGWTAAHPPTRSRPAHGR